ncbi:general odorant-binding protein 72-like [Sitophilus oryzae]|uniref:General odorant-binding protein 72-like n=2 Tax=Sitophilus TaxID=7045 RepID=A0A6J2Y687_SITOR|nr:general odorant-binding protein 72-like [Sitophilus oryzae]
MDTTMRLVLLAVLAILVHDGTCAMSDAQVKATMKLLKNTCMSKSKATEEQINAMHDGDWNQDKHGKCYLQCILAMNKFQKADNTLDWEAGVKMMEAQAPPSFRDHAITTLKHCKDAAQTLNDKCTAAYEIAKCVYDYDPEKYYWP